MDDDEAAERAMMDEHSDTQRSPKGPRAPRNYQSFSEESDSDVRHPPSRGQSVPAAGGYNVYFDGQDEDPPLEEDEEDDDAPPGPESNVPHNYL